MLVLDEPTSSLDGHSEKHVQGTIYSLFPQGTTLIISHRRSTVRHADCILVLNGGRIVEEGSDEELMAREDGLYRRLMSCEPG